MAIITISRQVGSLGDEIAASLAKRMNYELITREKIQALSYNNSRELANGLQFFETEMPPKYLRRFFTSDKILTTLFEALILKIASGADRIIVGRGAHIVLGNIPLVCKIRIVAPLDLRVKRIAAKLEWKHKRALEHVVHLDRQREVLIKTVFQKDLTDSTLYDLVLNTENLGVAPGAGIILRAVQETQLLQKNEAEVFKKLKRMALAKRVESVIANRCPNAPCRTLAVTVSEGGVVAISGYVRYKHSKAEIERIAAGVPGVARVDSGLKYVAVRL